MAVLALLTLLQITPAAAPEPGSAISAVDRPCAAGPGVDGEVVVCGHSRDADRLRPLPPLAATDRNFDPLGFRLPGGASGRLHAFRNELPGATSQGAAVTVTVPLGKKR